MAAIDFPNSPALNDEFTAGTTIYIWNGSVWQIKQSIPSSSMSNSNPLMNGVVAPGNSNLASRSNHVHPVDTSRASSTDLSTHTSATTSVHGISNTSNLVYTNDSRLTDSRTPTAHASSHGSAGSDAITIAQSQVTNLTTDLSAKAPLASPTFTGTPIAPTAVAGTNSTQIATTAYADTSAANAAAALVDAAPSTLDTLNELAAALGDDPNFATTVTNSIAGKVSKSGGDVITVESGTTVPLTIQNNGTGNSFVVNDIASDTSPFTISASGNVGIGGSTTGAKLEVFEGRSTMVANSEKYALLLKYNAAASNGAYLGSPDTGGLAISTQGGGELVRIDNSGRLGINETSPNTLLELTKSASDGIVSNNPFIVLSNRNTTNSTFISGGILNDTYRDIADPHYSAGIWFTREPYSGNFSSMGSIVFGAQFNTEQSSLPIERMRIDGNGRIKIPAGGIVEAPVSTNAQTGTGYTLVLTDAGRVIEMNNAAANTLTVPTDASVNFPVGTVIDIFQTGAGQTTVGGAGVTINARPGLKLSGQWATATLIKRATNTWLLTGSLSA